MLSEHQDVGQIQKLIESVADGQECLFSRKEEPSQPERYLLITQNWQYKPGRLNWLNKPSYDLLPWFGTRKRQRIPLDMCPKPIFVFDGPASEMVDLYTTGSDAYVVSSKLLQLIEDNDPASIEKIELTINCKDHVRQYYLVMPLRLVDAIDPLTTDIVVRSERYSERFITRVEFPTGIAFSDKLRADVHNFTDIDAPGWYWSIDLIRMAQNAGIRGVKVTSPQRADNIACDAF